MHVKRGLIKIDIKGYDVKIAALQAIKKQYPTATFYLETVANPKYPFFFIRFVQTVAERIGNNLYRFWFYLSVQYHHAADPASVSQLNDKLDSVGMELNDILQSLELYGTKRPCTDVKNSIVDNILQAFATITVAGSMPVEAVPIMEEIEIKEEIK